MRGITRGLIVPSQPPGDPPPAVQDAFQPLFRNVHPSPNDAGVQRSLPSHRVP